MRHIEWTAPAEECTAIWRLAGRTGAHGKHTVLSGGGVGTVERSTPWLGQEEWPTSIAHALTPGCRL